MKKPILIAFLTLVLSTLACTIFVGGPDLPEPPIPVSTEAVDAFKEQVKQAVETGAQSGTITLQINETQLTSYLAFKLGSQSSPLFTDPQVLLRDGQMKIFGKAHRGVFAANIGTTMTIGVDEQGQTKIEITEADFGPFPVPGGLKEAMTSVISEAYTGSLGPVATGFRLVNITIADGVMTVTGRVK